MANKFMERKIEAEILGNLYEKLEEDLKYAAKVYKNVGKEEKQAADWKTGELLWEDEEKTIPLYRDKWEYVDIPEDELTEEQLMRINVIKNVMAKLEKL